MHKRRFTLIAIPVLGFALFTASTRGESDAEARANAVVIQDIVAQQKALTENQTKIDTKLAEISEELRLARIFISRGRKKIMQRLVITFTVASLLFVSAAKSQAPLAVGGSLLSQLQAIQASNKTLLEQQKKTLETLDEMKAAAEQIKTFGKRG